MYIRYLKKLLIPVIHSHSQLTICGGCEVFVCLRMRMVEKMELMGHVMELFVFYSFYFS